MGKEVASLYATLGLKTDDFQRGVADSKSKLSGLSNAFQQLTGFSLGSAAALGFMVKGLQSVGRFLVESEQAAVEAARTSAKLDAVLTSTGGAAGMTRSELDGLAQTLSKQAGIDDELVTSAEAVLLTFTQIGRSAFPETLKAAADMAAVLGGDLQGSVMQIGKAMNDFTGYTMLKRAGVSFTEEQIKQIQQFKETNDLIGYQNLILHELSVEFGGAAKKMQEAGNGAENMKIAWENVKESVGDASSLRGATTGLSTIFDWLSKNQESANEFNAEVEKLTDHWVGLVPVTKEGYAVTEDMVEASLDAAAATQAYSDRLTAQAAAYKAINPDMTKYTGGLEDIENALIPTNAYLEKMTTNLLYNQAAAGLDSQSALKLAESMGLVPLQTGNAMDKLQELRDKLATGQITIEQYTAAVKRMQDTLNGISPGNITITTSNQNTQQQRAAGGWGMGWTLVGEGGPEMVKLPPGSQVFNNAASKNMKPGGQVNNFYGDNYFIGEGMTEDKIAQMRIQ